MTVKNVTVKNIFLRGIEFADGNDIGDGAFDFENNTVTNVQGDASQSVAIYNFGGHGTIANNTVSATPSAIATNDSFGTNISGNTITNSAIGIHSDFNGELGGVGRFDPRQQHLAGGLAGELRHLRIRAGHSRDRSEQHNCHGRHGPGGLWRRRRFHRVQRQHRGRKRLRNWRLGHDRLRWIRR